MVGSLNVLDDAAAELVGDSGVLDSSYSQRLWDGNKRSCVSMQGAGDGFIKIRLVGGRAGLGECHAGSVDHVLS